MSISNSLAHVFRKQASFTLGDAYAAVPDVKKHSVRARIYEGIKSGTFRRVSRGVFAVTYVQDGEENTCVLIQGDGRDLSAIPDESVDCIVTDHPYAITGQLKGGNRNFASYDLFQYTERDIREKARVLKPGCFLVEFLPEESAENFTYLTAVKQAMLRCGLEYYAKVPWIKEGFVANTGRKSKNAEDLLFFTKGRSRALRPDAKKNKADPSVPHYMSGAAGMLPAQFVCPPPSRSGRIHQAEKPLELLRAVLRYVTLPGELVLDQFAGSGVLGEACALEKRDAILIEKDPGYAAAIAARLGLLPVAA